MENGVFRTIYLPGSKAPVAL